MARRFLLLAALLCACTAPTREVPLPERWDAEAPPEPAAAARPTTGTVDAGTPDAGEHAPPPRPSEAEERAAAAEHPLGVFALAGRIYRSDAKGAPVLLTDTGRDAEPRLSADRGRIVFVRSTWGGSPEDGIWMMNADGTGGERIVAAWAPGDPTDQNEPWRNIEGPARPAFTVDGRSVYFETWGWMTSRAVQAVDLASRRVRFVTDGSQLRVIEKGPNRGLLFACKHEYHAGGGASDGCYLLRLDGSKVRYACNWNEEEKLRRVLGE
jgi:hypothetical protein